MCPTCARGIPAATKTEWHCCLCPSSNAQYMHCATGFVARMGWAAEPEISANVTSPQDPPRRKSFHMGKDSTCRKEEHVSKPTPTHTAKVSSGQRVVLKWSTCSSVVLETLCHLPCEQQPSFPKASCLGSWLAVSLLRIQIVFEVHTPGTFHMYHISAQMFGAVGHNNLWIEHLKLGEIKLISCSLGFNTRFQWNRSGIPTPSCRYSHTQDTFLSPRGELQVSDTGITVPIFSDQTRFRSAKACPEIGKQTFLHSMTQVGRRGEPQFSTQPLGEPRAANTFSTHPAQQDTLSSSSSECEQCWQRQPNAAKPGNTTALPGRSGERDNSKKNLN